MTLTLTAADNATYPGTGLTVAVAGSGGSAVALFARPADPAVGYGGWAPAGTLAGDGTRAVRVGCGLWWLYAAAGGQVTAPVYARATDGRDKPPTRCRAAVAARIAALNLPGIRRVYEQWEPDDANMMLPCVMLTVDGATERAGSSTNATDDVGYPVKVGIADTGGTPPPADKLPVFEAWRYAVERAFAGQPLPGVPESTRCEVEPYLVFDPSLPKYTHIVSGLLVRCFCRVPRGLGV